MRGDDPGARKELALSAEHASGSAAGLTQSDSPVAHVQPPPPETQVQQGVEEDHAAWALALSKPYAQVEAAVRRAREDIRLDLEHTRTALATRTEQLREMLGHVGANPWLSTGRGLLFTLLGVASTLAIQETGTVQKVAEVAVAVLLLAVFALQVGGHPGAGRAKAVRTELDGGREGR